jgi:chromosome segregation ATPase
MSAMTEYALTPLDEKIALALSKPISSQQVARLVDEARAALEAATTNAEAARERALNPTLTAREVARARESAQENAFSRDRLLVAVAKLEERLIEVCKAEENERRLAAYNQAKKQRDDLAAELKDVYPELSAKLADLASRIEASDRKVEAINRQLPEAERKLASAEAVARDIRSFDQGAASIPKISRALRLPAFEYSPHKRYVWPVNNGSIFN